MVCMQEAVRLFASEAVVYQRAHIVRSLGGPLSSRAPRVAAFSSLKILLPLASPSTWDDLDAQEATSLSHRHYQLTLGTTP
jgi:hypothetical protein